MAPALSGDHHDRPNVNKKNVKAQQAYRKHGFTVRGAVRGDIGGGFVKDDYVMEKPL